MHFVNPKNDLVFIKIFGNEQRKTLLTSFLNAILNLGQDREIVEVNLLPPDQAPKTDALKNHMLLDVEVTDKRNIAFFVKVQIEQTGGVTKHTVYHLARQHAFRTVRNKDYPRPNQIIFVGILDFIEFDSTHYITRILKESDQQPEIEFNFIELPKFTKSEGQLETSLEKWIYFLKHAANLEAMPANTELATLQMAYQIAEKSNWTPEELTLQDYYALKVQERHHELELTLEEGRQQGLREGRQQGLQQGLREGRQQGLQQGLREGQQHKATEMAGKMLADQLEPDLITKYTGLSVAELTAL